MEIGPTIETFTIEPIEDPFAPPAPIETPAPAPEREVEKEREREKVPA